MLPARVVEFHQDICETRDLAPAAPSRFWRTLLRWEYPLLLAIIGVTVYLAMDAQLAIESLGATSTWVSRTEGYENVKRDGSLRAMETELAQYDKILVGDVRVTALRADMRALREHSTLKEKARLALALHEIREAAEERDAAETETQIATSDEVGLDPSFDAVPDSNMTPATTTESMEVNPTMAGVL